MADPRAARPVRLLHISAAVGLSVAAAYALGSFWVAQPVLAGVNWLVSVAFAVAALLLASESHQLGNARLFAAAAVTWTLGYAGAGRQVGPLPLLVIFAGPLVFVPAATILLRYPDQRLARSSERRFVRGLLIWLVLIGSIWVIASRPAWLHFRGRHVWWPTLFASTRLSELISELSNIGGGLFIAAFLVLVVLRLRRTHAVDRHMLVPVLVVAAASGVAVAAVALAGVLPSTGGWTSVVLGVEALVMLAIPVSFLVAWVRGRLARAAVAELVVQIAAQGTVEVVRDALRQALRDPVLDVLYAVPEVVAGGYVDGDGVPVDPEVAGSGRLLLPVAASDRSPLGLVIVDPSLQRHTDLLTAAVGASALAMENARLHAGLRAQVEQLRTSRARIVEAGVIERRRVERDLHDGAQQRLLALTMHLAAAGALVEGQAAQTAITQARAELHEALAELRDLARGIHPAVLAMGGLGPAIEGVAERLVLPVEIDVPERRWEETIEATAYFLVCEALSNIVKYAGASAVRVVVRAGTGELSVEVTDDGVGGAGVVTGGGLEGLRDRVAAIGGVVQLTSVIHEGTRIVARIPCA